MKVLCSFVLQQVCHTVFFERLLVAPLQFGDTTTQFLGLWVRQRSLEYRSQKSWGYLKYKGIIRTRVLKHSNYKVFHFLYQLDVSLVIKRLDYKSTGLHALFPKKEKKMTAKSLIHRKEVYSTLQKKWLIYRNRRQIFRKRCVKWKKSLPSVGMVNKHHYQIRMANVFQS